MGFPHSLLIHETDSHGTFEEFLFTPNESTVLLLAPHGGQVEPNTDTQALLIADFVETATVWGTRGMTNEGYDASYNRWHTTSETHPLHMFPLYQNTLSTEYDVAMSFHVMSEDGVIIGGQADMETRESLANHLSRFFPTEDIRLGELGEPRAGMKDGNFVNTVSSSDAIHIEQSVSIATEHPNKFARAIAEWINRHY